MGKAQPRHHPCLLALPTEARNGKELDRGHAGGARSVGHGGQVGRRVVVGVMGVVEWGLRIFPDLMPAIGDSTPVGNKMLKPHGFIKSVREINLRQSLLP